VVQPAVGARSVLGRAIEKYNPGARLGPRVDINFDSVSVARNSPENPSTAITGSAGMDRGTPGGFNFDNKLKYDLTTERILMDLCALVGGPISIDALGAGATAPYRVKFRPVSNTSPRSLTLYLFEGGLNFGAHYDVGRQANSVQLATAANKRETVDVDYSEPVGDSISGFEIPATANAGTWAGKITTRGRRAYDSDYDDGFSLWIKVASADAGSVHFKAVMGAAAGDGTVPAPVVAALTAATIETLFELPGGPGEIKFVPIINGTTGAMYGLFGENFEPYEINFGHVFSDLSTLAAGDIFEIPWQEATLTKVTAAEHRLSAFHLIRNVAGKVVVFDSGTTKIARPYSPYPATGSKFTQSVDPTGDIAATLNFKKRLFDREFRRHEDASDRFSVMDVYQFGDVVVPADPTIREGVVIYYPQCRVSTLKSGDIANKNVQEETITLDAEQPVPAVSDVSLGGFAGASAFEINVISITDPLTLGIDVG
jgi:hypothetical protein